MVWGGAAVDSKKIPNPKKIPKTFPKTNSKKYFKGLQNAPQNDCKKGSESQQNVFGALFRLEAKDLFGAVLSPRFEPSGKS